MKLDLTREQREALESAVDIIQDLIEEKTQTKDDLLSETYEVLGPHLSYLYEQVDELAGDIDELVGCAHAIKRLTN